MCCRHLQLELLRRMSVREDSCTICFDNHANVCLQPCGHKWVTDLVREVSAIKPFDTMDFYQIYKKRLRVKRYKKSYKTYNRNMGQTRVMQWVLTKTLTLKQLLGWGGGEYDLNWMSFLIFSPLISNYCYLLFLLLCSINSKALI